MKKSTNLVILKYYRKLRLKVHESGDTTFKDRDI